MDGLSEETRSCRKTEMMGDSKESVKLHGMWASPWVRRVEIALKIKGIPYDYFEENLKNKSQMLLQYNPIKKLVPVLVHNGNPIPESLIIIEYLDQTWTTNSPNLLPLHPYHRATVRFWANFIDLQVFEKLRDVMKTQNDDEEEKVIKEVQKNMGILEANVKDLRSSSSVGVLDILMATLLPIIKAVEEAIQINFINAEEFPLAFSWMASLHNVPAVQDTLPNHHNLVKFHKKLRHYFRKPSL